MGWIDYNYKLEVNNLYSELDMNALVNLIPISPDLWIYLVTDMVIAIFLLTMLRWISGRLAKESKDKKVYLL